MYHLVTMNCVLSVLFVVQLALLHSAQSKPLCDFSNTECTTNAARNGYKAFIAGIEGVVESSDPLQIKTVKEEWPGLVYKLTNLRMTGLTNCQVTEYKVNDEELTYHYSLLCPQLVLNHDYDINGILGPVETIGKGTALVTLTDYVFHITGKYVKYTSVKDQKLHFRLKKYDVEFERKGTLTLDLQGPLNSDEVKSKTAKDWLYGNLNEYEKMLRSPTLKNYVAKLVENFDIFLKATPIEDILSAP